MQPDTNLKNSEMSAVIDMESIEVDDLEGDMESMNHRSVTTASPDNDNDGDGTLPTKHGGDSTQSMQGQLTKMVWLSGQQKARHWFSIYANIDLLRPYFDVEPREVIDRLVASLSPFAAGEAQRRLHRELYGPSMVILTLISLLLLLMKTSDHYVEEGTLIGTAFTVCFGYWIGFSTLVWFFANFTNTHMTLIQILSVIGYSLFGHCIVILFGIIYHISHSHTLFYICYLIVGALSSARLIVMFASKTPAKLSKIMICGLVVGVHMSFLLYLHFSYHIIVEDISMLVKQPILELSDNEVPPSVMSELKKHMNNVSKPPVMPLASLQ